jgi:predicted dehydrogenase
MAQNAPNAIRLPKRVNLGMIGFDGHPEEILRQLPRLPDVKLVAYAVDGSDPGALAAHRKNPVVAGARSHDTYKELLEREKLDLVAVCDNDARRCGAVLACSEMRLPVIAEKPLALNSRDLAKVERAFGATSSPRLSMLLPMRFDPPYLAMKAIVDSGQIGEVTQVVGQKSYQLGARPEWQKHRSTYGSTVLWIGPHVIDLMRHCSGRELVEVFGYQARPGGLESGDMETVTAAVYRLDNGGVATMHMDYLRPAAASGHGDDRLRIAGTKGIVEYSEGTGVVVMTQGEKPAALKTLPAQGSVFLDFLESLYLGKPQSLSREDIFRVNAITLATHEAATEHRIVMI